MAGCAAQVPTHDYQNYDVFRATSVLFFHHVPPTHHVRIWQLCGLSSERLQTAKHPPLLVVQYSFKFEYEI